jgi:hypothetical protein
MDDRPSVGELSVNLDPRLCGGKHVQIVVVKSHPPGIPNECGKGAEGVREAAVRVRKKGLRRP